MEIRNMENMEGNVGGKTLRGELPEGIDIVRDPYIFFGPEESATGITAGYAHIYPGCRAGGHYHEKVEEVYHVVRGRGRMTVGNNSYTIKQGDTFLVPLFQWHSTENTGNGTLELYWTLIPVPEDRIPENKGIVGVPPEIDAEELKKHSK